MQAVNDIYRRGDALYFDSVSRRELCDKVARIEAEERELRDCIADLWRELHAEQGSWQRRDALRERMRALGVEVE